MDNNSYISIKGAKEHNLKNISIDIPKYRITVITGLSGSGKSSLAFDTIYAEGQRRYVESLSAYARQFLEVFDKPDVDSIDGLSPAISIEQKTTSKNPRSTVGTITEIFDYLRLLFSKIGIPFSPTTGLPITKQTIPAMVETIMKIQPNTKIHIEAPLVRGRKGEYKKEFESLRKQGFQRVHIDGIIYNIDEIPNLDKNIKHDISVVVDRLIIKESIRQRLMHSIETTLNLSKGICLVNNLDTDEHILLSEKFACPVSGFSIEDIEPRLFSFNSIHGACPHCNGLGTQQYFDVDLVIPIKSKPLVDAIAPWNSAIAGYYRAILTGVAKHYNIDPRTPYMDLSEDFKKIVLYGSGSTKIMSSFESSNMSHKINKPFEGVMVNLERRFRTSDSENSRDSLSSYQKSEICNSCKGKRLNNKALQVKIDNLDIIQITDMSLHRCLSWIFDIEQKLPDIQKQIASKILKEIRIRLEFLNNVGIGYLSLSRYSATLSGGESQRIRLASQIGSGLTGVLYVLDEPSIGLHQRDNNKLLETLDNLKNLGNTVIVVEHDEDTINHADFLIDMGPKAGEHGGTIVAAGTLEQVKSNPKSITAKYLNKELSIKVPSKTRVGNGKFISIKKASGNNLKNINVDFPLGILVCVTGVSGSGKSTLVNDTLYKAASQYIYNSKDDPAPYEKILGLEHIDKVIDIDQSPIGRMPSSNPATYTKVFDAIRGIFAETKEAKAYGYKIGRFSFNVKGGRCETCKGDGVIKIEMSFLPDVFVRCEECNGKRYNIDTLSIKWKGKSIADVLNLTVEEALAFFDNIPSIKNKLQALNDVGLGYIRLGQSATTFSGGEAQRIKLAKELSKKSTGNTLYILDEPTTGLHFEDVNNLMSVINKLVDIGNSVIIIEHNLDVIKMADHIIDIGPQGGSNGGEIVVQGSKQTIINNPKSYTGLYLKPYLKR